MTKALFPYLPEMHKNTIGLFEQLERVCGNLSSRGDGYPPFDIIKEGEKYTLCLAVAGFKLEDLEVLLSADGRTGSRLEISGEQTKSESEKSQKLHSGIASRSFRRVFALGQNIEVKDITLTDGILSVTLEDAVPDTASVRVLDIKAS